jgi:hypothetical protein
MLARLRRRLSLPFSPPSLSRLDGAQFTALILGLLLFAAWLTARGLESFSDQRRRVLFAELNRGAASPLAHLAHVPRTAALLGPSPAGLTAAVRADSLPDPAEARRLCALAAAAAGAGIRFLALSDAVPACVAAGPGAAPVTVPPAARAAVRGELRSARWMLVDAGARVRYSRRDVPTADDVAGVAALLGSPPATAASPASTGAPSGARGR